MKTFKTIILILQILVLITSCADEGRFRFYGIVLEAETNTPIDSVQCTMYLNGDLVDEILKDTLGHFRISWSGYIYDHCCPVNRKFNNIS